MQLYNAFIQSKLSAYNSMYSVRAAAVQTKSRTCLLFAVVEKIVGNCT